ncbi:MAG: FAD-dependent oxidoreductase [Bacteroidota bacterium]
MISTDMNQETTIILGAGVTGLACGAATGYTIFEKNRYPGGICSSYYMTASGEERSAQRRTDEEDYRFEYGGGHWIFGSNAEAMKFLSAFDTFKTYNRKSSVYIRSLDASIPFPIQNNLRYLPFGLSQKILTEILQEHDSTDAGTMHEWCELHFGRTLSELFFHPFHNLYTSGLWKVIQPQDGYKSPVNKEHIIEGAQSHVSSVGYNVSFVYPEHGLSALTSGMEKRCTIQYNKEVISIDVNNRRIFFNDGSDVVYDQIITTLPLNVMQNITRLSTRAQQDPYTSVLVLNIGAKKGKREIDDHWIYFPETTSGFHRVGFYHNVDQNFLPLSKRNGGYVSLYVEKSFRGGERLIEVEIENLTRSIISELRGLELIGDVEICDPTWIDVAYTWSFPRSSWREEMISSLRANNIRPVGRYAAWKFQGILDSIHDGLRAGSIEGRG